MQLKSLRTKSYRSWKIDDRPVSKKAWSRHRILKKFWRLKEERCTEATIFTVLGYSRATIYRWQSAYRLKGPRGLEPLSRAPRRRRTPQWGKALERQVLCLRKAHPLWGKKTLTTLLHREQGLSVSESTVGRVLNKLRLLDKIRPVSFYYGRVKAKKRRQFVGHAQRWKKGYKASEPGQLLQIDHMTVPLIAGETVKHFKATCPVTKLTVAKVYRSASSRNARDFLMYVRQKLPFDVQSIQVDGGSEFMKDFEVKCEDINIPLYVIPPRTPELNGCVERCNRTVRYEFYRVYQGSTDLGDVQDALQKYMEMYNEYRPHQALNQLTPMEYYRNTFGGAPQSHM